MDAASPPPAGNHRPKAGPVMAVEKPALICNKKNNLTGFF
jgi:hypothetical protein